jgi:hypothetical protein
MYLKEMETYHVFQGDGNLQWISKSWKLLKDMEIKIILKRRRLTVYIEDDCVSLDIWQAGCVGAAGQPLTAVLLAGHDVNDAHRHIVISRGHLCQYYYYCFFYSAVDSFPNHLDVGPKDC